MTRDLPLHPARTASRDRHDRSGSELLRALPIPPLEKALFTKSLPQARTGGELKGDLCPVPVLLTADGCLLIASWFVSPKTTHAQMALFSLGLFLKLLPKEEVKMPRNRSAPVGPRSRLDRESSGAPRPAAAGPSPFPKSFI